MSLHNKSCEILNYRAELEVLKAGCMSDFLCAEKLNYPRKEIMSTYVTFHQLMSFISCLP